MSLFLRLLGEEDKGGALADAVRSVAAGAADRRVFQVAPESFERVPGAPFAYWVSEEVRGLFQRLLAFEGEARTVKQGLATADDFRFVRVAWEEPAAGSACGGASLPARRDCRRWWPFAKGGFYAPFYADVHLVVNWGGDGAEIRGFVDPKTGRTFSRPQSIDFYLRPGLTWPRRSQKGLAPRAMPAGCIFADKGPAAFVAGDDPQALLALLAVVNSAAFRALVALQMAFGSYEVGVIQRTPIPELSGDQARQLAGLARRAWSLRRSLDTAEPTSHAFTLPALLQAQGPTLAGRAQAWAARVEETEAELARIQVEIDERCFDLYGFAPEDRAATLVSVSIGDGGEEQGEHDGEGE